MRGPAWRLGGGAFLAVVRAQRQLNRERLALVEARGQRLADVVEPLRRHRRRLARRLALLVRGAYLSAPQNR